MKSTNITWHQGIITRKKRNDIMGYSNRVLWFTGLSGSGKSTIAREVENILSKEKRLCYVLDGDNIRHGLNNDLGFSPEEREENIRRIGEVTRLFYDAGIMTIVSFISPYARDRNWVRQLIGTDFIEIHVKCLLEICEQRDPKELYKKAREGKIKGFTGIDAPYEEPENPEITIDTNKQSIEDCVSQIVTYLHSS